MTVKEYLRDDALSGVVRLVEIIDGEKPIVRLDRSWFHGQGGGQRADRGRIAGRTVVDVRHNGRNLDHHMDSVEGLTVGEEYTFDIDPSWRLRNAGHHTAGHLIASEVEVEFPSLKAVSGHHWLGEARVEFEICGLEINLDHFRLILREKLVECVRADLPISLIGDPFANRSIQIGLFAAIPCGGTHLRSLGQMEQINITGVRRKSGRLRVSYETYMHEYLG